MSRNEYKCDRCGKSERFHSVGELIKKGWGRIIVKEQFNEKLGSEKAYNYCSKKCKDEVLKMIKEMV